MKILVTGTAGRIGAAIRHRLAHDGEVVGLDRRPSPHTDVVADITDAAALRAALRGVGAVVHTAALHAPHVGQCSDAEFEDVNVGATRTLARLAAEAGVRRFVFTSTTALYGAEGAHPEGAAWVDEDTVPRPRTVYHRSKRAAERWLEAFAPHAGMAVTVLRMSRCFPEPAPLMAAYRLHRGVDARDVADAHALALHDTAPGCRRFVISGATPFERADTGELLHDPAAVLHRRAPALVQAFARRGWPLPASIDRVYVARRAMQVLGWQPRFGFDDVIADADAGATVVVPVQAADCCS